MSLAANTSHSSENTRCLSPSVPALLTALVLPVLAVLEKSCPMCYEPCQLLARSECSVQCITQCRAMPSLHSILARGPDPQIAGRDLAVPCYAQLVPERYRESIRHSSSPDPDPTGAPHLRPAEPTAGRSLWPRIYRHEHTRYRVLGPSSPSSGNTAMEYRHAVTSPNATPNPNCTVRPG